MILFSIKSLVLRDVLGKKLSNMAISKLKIFKDDSPAMMLWKIWMNEMFPNENKSFLRGYCSIDFVLLRIGSLKPKTVIRVNLGGDDMSKRLNILPGDANTTIILKSIINSKYAELEVLKKSEKSEVHLLEIFEKESGLAPVNHLNNIALKQKRIEALISSLILSLQEATDARIEWEEIDDKKEADQLSSIYHRLWTKAVGATGYDKAEWLRLQKLLLRYGIET